LLGTKKPPPFSPPFRAKVKGDEKEKEKGMSESRMQRAESRDE